MSTISSTVFWTVLVLSNSSCLFLGFLFGRVARAAGRIEEKMEEGLSQEAEEVSDDEVSEEKTENEKGEVSSRKEEVFPLRLMSASVAVIGIVTAVFGLILIIGQGKLADNQEKMAGCVAGYSNALADALSSSRAANREVNEKVDSVFQAFADAFSQAPSDAREKVFTAISNYLEERKKARETLAANPLPEAPRDACAKLLD